MPRWVQQSPWLLLVFTLCWCTSVWPQSSNIERSAEIKRALQRGEFQLATALADSAIAHFQDFTPVELAEIHALRGLLAHQRRESAAVDAHFRSALQLSRTLQLDPIFFSPVLQQRFEQIRSQMPPAATSVQVETRYLMIPDQRVDAAWRSLVLPGWGQRFKGQKIRGQVFLFSTAALAGATLTAHFLRERAEERYLQANAAEVKARYRTFNRYHLLRNNLALGLAVVWAASSLDALIVRAIPPEKSGAVDTRLQFAADTAVLALRISF
ncbi:MAG: hypothetical protein ONB48_06270 [candidate division KSB1 bacterium]|nr:hypothetical protein [candidate division KSB1 bacterium]MDZ7273146.1 hypothetical protein [candidate division KSB1 bacterium]MDZ7285248.1 hypothetical protein [candidate division KSB1 bacterium]MDZ7298280.1 hypothetical protein [candidate division KSB1 bacterium]MDZ7306639.1 hypothetical protein [candidate division KSB1 bacterium]